jgi:hypothetical protein
MEILLAIIIIIVICKILGVSNFVLILCGLGIIELIIIAMFLFFIYHTLHLFFTKKRNANFVKIDKPKKGKFKVAYYEIENEEYPCVFPMEASFSSSYREEKIYSVRYSKLLKKVYDKWAVMTCFIGLIFSIVAIAITFSIIKNLDFII